MLYWIRRYQQFIYVTITVVIVISFTFFGTYGAFQSPYPKDDVVFRAWDGSKVKRSELESFAHFIASDQEEKKIYGGAWGPNFLNNGVIKRDFMESGLFPLLFSAYRNVFISDLERKRTKERHYRLYRHPQAPFINTKQVWSSVAQDLLDKYDTFQKIENPTTEEAIAARIELFLAERSFPSSALRYALRFQEKQYQQLIPDRNLEYADLTLFGYHHAEDWFGPAAVRFMSAFVINTAKMAEKQGYRVSAKEAWNDLLAQADKSLQENPNQRIGSTEQYLHEQLRRMGMDKSRATEIWREVLLFRKVLHEQGRQGIVDEVATAMLDPYRKKYVEVDLYQWPSALQITHFRDLQHLFTYMDAVSSKKIQRECVLPKTHAPLQEIEKQTPELVQNQFVLDIASVNQHVLATQIPIKETWEWEVHERNWPCIRERFPEIGGEQQTTREERFALLDRLSNKVRAKIDQFARITIIENNPERLVHALEQTAAVRKTISLRKRGGNVPLPGFAGKPIEQENFVKLLETAALPEMQEVTKDALSFFTPDNIHYYRITPVEQAPEKHLFLFEEAQRDGTLESLTLRKLETFYQTLRGKNPTSYQKQDGSWKELREVRDEVAALYWKDRLDALRTSLKNSEASFDALAQHALENEFRKEMEKIQKEDKSPVQDPLYNNGCQ